MSNPTHAEFIQGLRELADFYSAHPEVALPDSKTLSIYYFGHNAESKIIARDQMIATARAFGKSSKDYISDYFFLRREFSGEVKLEAATSRETVCEPVVVGYVDEPEQVIPEKVIPASRRPQIEWQCGKSLLAAAPMLGEGALGLKQPEGVEVPEEGRLLEAPLTDSDIPF